MIELQNVSKVYPTRTGTTTILDAVDFQVLPGEHVGILGQNGAGKSTLIRVLSGSEQATVGKVTRGMSVSWPLAFGGAFLGALTGLDNVRFVCRLYGVDPEEKIQFVEEFTELGKYLREPVRSYSSGMRARLAFATSMAVDFDCYLIDEIVAVGDDRFQRKCQVELFEKRGDRAMLLVSHSADFVRAHCDRASVLVAGKLTNFDDVDEAYHFYASHELAMQPHMATQAVERVFLPGDTIERVSAAAQKSSEEELIGLFHELRFTEVPVFDSCDVAGRLMARGEVRAATSLSEFLTKERSDVALFWITLGDILCKQRQHVPGCGAYIKALELDSSSFWGHRNLAIELFNTGRYAEAVTHFRHAKSLSSNIDQRLELEARLADCHYLLDKPYRSTLNLEQAAIVEHSGICLEGGGPMRLMIGGILPESMSLEGVKCVFRSSSWSELGVPSYASSSLRRLSESSGTHAFCFLYYGLPPLNVGSWSVELSRDGVVLATGTYDYEVTTTRIEFVAGDQLQSAQTANVHHEALPSVLFYGASGQSVGGQDRIHFAENLVHAGFYAEAEDRLTRWIEEGSIPGPERDFLLDLLCVEVARSRLLGWRERNEALVANEEARGRTVSVVTNLGHARLAHDDLANAIRLYAEASDAAGSRPLIHFASGIHTARFARQAPIPGPSAAGNSAPARTPAADIVHLFACDAKYFKSFARSLVASSRHRAAEVRLIIHAHVIDPDETSDALAEELKQEYGLCYSTGSLPANMDRQSDSKRAYFTCARFLIAPELLDRYGCPMLITETDALITWNWSDIIDHVGGADLAYTRSGGWNWVPWTRIPAGILYIAANDLGRSWCDHVASFIAFAFANSEGEQKDVWTVDQVALWLADHFFKDADKAHIPMYSVLGLATGDKTNILNAPN